MKILFVYKEDYPWDVRVEKIVTALNDVGHDVTLLARNSGRRQTAEDMGPFRIRRLPTLPRWCGRLNALFGTPLFFNPIWLHALWRTLADTDARVVIVRDLPLMPCALLVARALRRQVVFDMAECYPEMYRSILQFNANRLMNWFTKNPWVTMQIERIAVRQADHTLVMIEESRDRLLRLGFDSHKITIVSNTPVLPDSPPREHAEGGVLRLLYVGYITRIRGLDNLLYGLRVYRNSRTVLPPVEFHVVGVGDALAEYRTLAIRLGVDDCVHFHGWCEQDFVDALYATSDIGVLTYHVCGHWNHTIPNKLFDYMRSGMPVLATEVRPIRRIVEQEACGLIIPDGDFEACGRAIAQLADPILRATLGRRGRAAVQRYYNWQHDCAHLHEVVASLVPTPSALRPSFKPPSFPGPA
jgi:glycosyltransferase involved in cell wall biosynthesis